MSEAVIQHSQKKLLKWYAMGIVGAWTIVAIAIIALDISLERKQAVETAQTHARSDLKRDVIYRQWNAAYGPIYAPISKDIRPNQYLDMPSRDATTTTGKKLTQINPAYMSRLVFELAGREYGVKGHITSLKPVRPGNRADPWETVALKTFEAGAKEVSSVETLDGSPYLRMMIPLVTQQECLQCHRKQGYRAGDIRGGISVAVPMEPLYGTARRNIIRHSLSIALLWLAGLGGIAFGALRLNRTITQRDKAEGDVVALNQSLKAANHELEAFSFTVSHDLRSPLSTVGGFCGLLREVPPEKHGERCAKYSGIIEKEVVRMEKLIDALLEFSRSSRGAIRCEPLDLAGLAAEIAEELKTRFPERSVDFRIAADLVVLGDPPLLRVVMHNLLSNAWKYTGRQQHAEIEFGVTERNGETAYFVKDNGAGFDGERAGDLFEAFKRLHTDKEFQGSGIGLATVKRIIERHGGRVWAEGEVGKGATFYFTIPPTAPAQSETA